MQAQSLSRFCRQGCAARVSEMISLSGYCSHAFRSGQSGFSCVYFMTCFAAACLSRALLQVASVSRCGSVAFREMCSLLQIPEMQRVRLLELIADSLEPGAAEAFSQAHAKAPPPSPPASVVEEVQAEPASVNAPDDGYDDYWWHEANWGWYGSSWDQPSWRASGGYGQWNLAALGANSKRTIIMEAEFLALICALQVWAGLIRNAPVTAFIDNNSCRDIIISAKGRSKTVKCLLQHFLKLEHDCGIIMWVARVPSPSNIADEPSRRSMHSISWRRSLVSCTDIAPVVNDIIKHLG